MSSSVVHGQRLLVPDELLRAYEELVGLAMRQSDPVTYMDLLQLAMLTILEKDTYDKRRPAAPYLRAVVRNLLRDHYRRERCMRDAQTEYAQDRENQLEAPPSPLAICEEEERLNLIRAGVAGALARLSTRDELLARTRLGASSMGGAMRILRLKPATAFRQRKRAEVALAETLSHLR